MQFHIKYVNHCMWFTDSNLNHSQAFTWTPVGVTWLFSTNKICILCSPTGTPMNFHRDFLIPTQSKFSQELPDSVIPTQSYVCRPEVWAPDRGLHRQIYMWSKGVLANLPPSSNTLEWKSTDKSVSAKAGQRSLTARQLLRNKIWCDIWHLQYESDPIRYVIDKLR